MAIMIIFWVPDGFRKQRSLQKIESWHRSTVRSSGEKEIDLGGLSVRVVHCPGHTDGSAVAYVPERSLLLTGDDWNPCTWLFFPEALPVQEYRKNIRKLLDLPFQSILCPHRRELYERSMLEDFITGISDENLISAKPVDTGSWMGIQTVQAEPAPDQCLVFDSAKMNLNIRGI